MTGGVQRWDCSAEYSHEGQCERVAVTKDPDGDWVRYGDIAGMASENARLRKCSAEDYIVLGAVTERLKQVEAERDTAMSEAARLRKALEGLTAEALAVANGEGYAPLQALALNATEALRGAAGEVGK